MNAYEEMFNKTSTPHAPWYIIPADHKWFTRFAVVSIINHTLDNLHLAYPAVSREQQEALLTAKAEMEKEDGDTRDQSLKKKTKKKVRPA